MITAEQKQLQEKYQQLYPKMIVDVLLTAKQQEVETHRRLLQMDWHVSSVREIVDGEHTVFLVWVDLNEAFGR